MPTKIDKSEDRLVQVTHEPGNGTKYVGIGVGMPLGYATDWMVIFPLLGVAAYFNNGSFVSVAYVEEKMGYQSNGLKIGEVDLHEMTKVISIITGGKNNAATDDRGYLTPVRLAR